MPSIYNLLSRFYLLYKTGCSLLLKQLLLVLKHDFAAKSDSNIGDSLVSYEVHS